MVDSVDWFFIIIECLLYVFIYLFCDIGIVFFNDFVFDIVGIDF